LNADLLLALKWESATPTGIVRHRDHLFAGAVDVVRDGLPNLLKEKLASARPGNTVSVSVDDLVGTDGEAVLDVPRENFHGRRADGAALTPKFGRFYPASYFSGVSCKGPVVRCVGLDSDTLKLDARHPLTGRALELSAKVVGNLDAMETATRSPIDWTCQLVEGPGLQACWQGEATDFLDDAAYLRPDEGHDPDFYAMPRITAHIDSRAQQTIGQFYRRFLPKEGRMLDLMSSVHSNLARDQQCGALIGLGLNAPELVANDKLDGAVVSDLNAGRSIPFADNTFDAAICTVSIDYLTDPIETVGEIARVLRPGAPFAVSFSNRWFPPKVTRLWTELYPFEQMALVVRYFQQAGRFEELETASFRGYPRPMDDPYYRQLTEADPVFAVAGRVV